MWIWWIVSLIILIACIIFAYRMIVSSYKFLPADKRFFLGFNKEPITNETGTVQRDAFKVLKNKVQSVEDNTTFYEIQFSKFQQRLKALEELNSIKATPEKISKIEDDEDWKEMYYEENTLKEKLENDLDNTRQLLDAAVEKLKEAKENSAEWAALKSDYESRLHDLGSLQNHIDLLNNQLLASAEREKELEQLLISEITIREKYSMLQKEYTELLSETDDLRRRIVELSKRDVNLEVRLVYLGELESRLAICETEKLKLKANLEKLMISK